MKAKDAAQQLTALGIAFSTANKGLHFMISHQCRRIDFWPTTGKWIERGFRDCKGFGIDTLIARIRGED